MIDPNRAIITILVVLEPIAIRHRATDRELRQGRSEIERGVRNRSRGGDGRDHASVKVTIGVVIAAGVAIMSGVSEIEAAIRDGTRHPICGRRQMVIITRLRCWVRHCARMGLMIKGVWFC